MVSRLAGVNVVEAWDCVGSVGDCTADMVSPLAEVDVFSTFGLVI